MGEVTTVIGEGYFKENEVGMAIFDEDSYQTVVVKDSKGEELMKVEDAIVSTKGYLGFTSRGCGYIIDNIKIALNYEITPEPTTPTPDITPEVTPEKTNTPQPTSTGDDAGDSGANTLTFVLIGVAVVLIGGIVYILIPKKK